MSIYIFKPSASSTVPTFQEVLNSGSYLNTNNVINLSYYNIGFQYGNVNFGYDGNKYFQFFHDALTGNTVFTGNVSGGDNIQGINIDLANGVYQFGDIVNGNYFSYDIVTGKVQSFGALIQWNGGVIRNFTDTFQIKEATLGAGQIAIDGTGYTAATAGGSAGQHLIVKINGVTRKIALLLP